MNYFDIQKYKDYFVSDLSEGNKKKTSLARLIISDKKNVRAGIKLGVDWIALSFIQSPTDIKDLKKICHKNISIMANLPGFKL